MKSIIIVRMGEKTSKRIREADVAKAFAVCAVILQHAGVDDGYAFMFISSFHVPLFFVLSAYFGAEKLKDKDCVHRRFLRLLGPYLCFSMIDTFVGLAVIFIKSRTFDTAELLRCLSLFLSGFGISVTWFLSALIASELLFSRWLRAKKITKMISAVLAVLLFLLLGTYGEEGSLGSLLILWYADSSQGSVLSFFLCCIVSALARLPFCLIVYGGTYLLTPLIKKAAARLNALRGGIRLILTAVFALLFITICFFISVVNGGGSMGMVYYGFIPLLFVLSLISGCLGIIFLSRLICALRISKPLEWIGANSLIIMLTHMDMYLLSPARLIASRLTGSSDDALYFALTLLFTLLEEIPLVLIINRFFPVLAARAPRKVNSR